MADSSAGSQVTDLTQQPPLSSASPGPGYGKEGEGKEEEGVLLSAEVYWRVFPVMDQVLYVLGVTGLVLNTINIIVMTRPSMRSPTSTFLVALSVLQLVYILIRLLPAIHRLFKPLKTTDAFYLINSIYIINYGLTCLRRSMYCLQCFISTERLLAVWLPLKAKQFLLVRRPWLFILTTPVLVFLTHLHVLLKIEVFSTVNTKKETIYSFRYSQYYHPEVFNTLSISLKVVFVYLTLLMLIAINLAMIKIIKQSAAVRKRMKTNVDMSAAQKRESQMTLTILVSTLIFVVLCLPTVSSSLAANAAPKNYGPFSVHRYLYLFMNKFGGLLFVLAFSTDFFTYVSLSSAYRNTLLRMFRMKWKQEMRSSQEDGSKAAVTTLS